MMQNPIFNTLDSLILLQHFVSQNMLNINFIMGGMMGDFIHSLYAVKNICLQKDAKANIYITDQKKYGGDIWRLGIQKAYEDLKDLVVSQSYVNSFQVLPSGFNEPHFNMNSWRTYIEQLRVKNGGYTLCWTEIMSQTYNFPISSDIKWLETSKDDYYKDKFIINRSTHRHNPEFLWDEYINICPFEIIFAAFSIQEWEEFPYKNDKIALKLFSNINEMAIAINSCKAFAANQSAPFAIACALDVERSVELHKEPSVFYMNEIKYSSKIAWFLDNDTIISNPLNIN